MKENSIEEDINTALDILIDNCINNKEMTALAYVQLKQPILLIFHKLLKDRERLQKENEELRKKPNFYYDNNRNTYVWSCRCFNTNMSLHMFLENGEIEQYASEYYDQWCENVKEVKKVDVCEFMHNFVKPLIKELANSISKDTIKEKLENYKKQTLPKFRKCC